MKTDFSLAGFGNATAGGGVSMTTPLDNATTPVATDADAAAALPYTDNTFENIFLAIRNLEVKIGVGFTPEASRVT